jgi:hypothetical protein
LSPALGIETALHERSEALERWRLELGVTGDGGQQRH